MPLVKNSLISGAKDSIEIISIQIDIDQKHIHVGLRLAVIDSNGIPRTQLLNASLIDENRQIIDQAWGANSTPPKPAGFLESDQSTWNGLTWPQIPKIVDPAGQYFSTLAGSDPAGTTIYGRLKNGLYTALMSSGKIPGSVDGWSIQ